MRKFYPCLSCGTTEKSIQTFFCGRCEESLMPKVKSKLVNEKLMMDRETEKQQEKKMSWDKLIEEMYENKIWEK